MFHTCVQRFDGMDEKILGGELNRALDAPKNPKLYKIPYHIESYGTCMEY